MPLFTHGSSLKKQRVKGGGLKARLKRLFHRNTFRETQRGETTLIHRAGIMFARSMIVLVIGVAWWVAAPQLFFVLLPSFNFYNQLLKNMGTSVNDVYQIWQVVPEVLLFLFAPFWTGGVLDMLFRDSVLEKVF